MKVANRRQVKTTAISDVSGGTPFLYADEYYLKASPYTGMNQATRAVRISDGEIVHFSPDVPVAVVDAEFSLL
jgi:hypothetical protein